MNFLWYLLISVLSGIFAGMGMGGGTFLIPLLTLLMNTFQNVAQCLNLLVFIPMAIITIIIYSKQKLIDFKSWWWVSVPACIISLVGVFVATSLPAKILKVIFGGFIALIGVVQITCLIVGYVKRKNKCKKQ